MYQLNVCGLNEMVMSNRIFPNGPQNAESGLVKLPIIGNVKIFLLFPVL